MEIPVDPCCEDANGGGGKGLGKPREWGAAMKSFGQTNIDLQNVGFSYKDDFSNDRKLHIYWIHITISICWLEATDNVLEELNGGDTFDTSRLQLE